MLLFYLNISLLNAFFHPFWKPLLQTLILYNGQNKTRVFNGPGEFVIKVQKGEWYPVKTPLRQKKYPDKTSPKPDRTPPQNKTESPLVENITALKQTKWALPKVHSVHKYLSHILFFQGSKTKQLVADLKVLRLILLWVTCLRAFARLFNSSKLPLLIEP